MLKYGWMIFSFGMLVLCAILVIGLFRNNDENRKKCEEANRTNEASYQNKYQDLGALYIDVARNEASSLTTMMLKPKLLREYYPRYKDMNDDELAKAVRKDIGRLEIKVEELEKLK